MKLSRHRFQLLAANASFFLNILFGVYLVLEDCSHKGVCWWIFVVRFLSISYWAIKEFTSKIPFNTWMLTSAFLSSTLGSQIVISKLLSNSLMIILNILVISDLLFILLTSYRVDKKNAYLSCWSTSIKGGNKAYDKSEFKGLDIGKPSEPASDKYAMSDTSSEGSNDDDDDDDYDNIVEDYCSFFDLSNEGFSVCTGVTALVIGICGWIISFIIMAKVTSSSNGFDRIGDIWFTLVHIFLLFLWYSWCMANSNSFSYLIPFVFNLALPISILVRESDKMRNQISFKNDIDVKVETEEFFSLVGCCLLICAASLLIISLGVLHHSWNKDVKVSARPVRAFLTVLGVIGLIMMIIGLRDIQNVICQETNICKWNEQLWVILCIQIIVNFLGALSTLSQPGEGSRSIIIAISIIPLQSYILDADHIIKLYQSHSSYLDEHKWSLRLMVTGFMTLCLVNYMWIFQWSMGRAYSGTEFAKEDLKLALSESVENKSIEAIKIDQNQGNIFCEVEMGEIEEASSKL